MPSLILPIDVDGVMVDIEIGWSFAEIRAARRLGRPIPPPMQGRALVDTGADSSCVDSAFLQQLGLPYGGLTMVNVPSLGGVSFAPSHDVRLTVVHPSVDRAHDLVLSDILIMGLDLGTLGYQALLGRDVLAHCRFLFDGPGKRFKLRY